MGAEPPPAGRARAAPEGSRRRARAGGVAARAGAVAALAAWLVAGAAWLVAGATWLVAGAASADAPGAASADAPGAHTARAEAESLRAETTEAAPTESEPPRAETEAPRVERPRGPPRFELGDADNRVRLEWIAQLRVDVRDEDLRSGAAEATVEVRRMRLRLNGELAGGALRPVLQLDLGPSRGGELFDLFADVRLSGAWTLRAGQWKVPYTRWRINPFSRSALGEWGPLLQWFGSERQLGVAVHDGSERPPEGFELQAGVFSGVNARPTQGNGVALVSGDPVPGHSSLAGRNEPPRLHPEVVVHAAWNAPGVDTASELDRTREGTLRWSVGASAAWDLQPDAWRDFALRLAPEAWLKWRGWSLVAVGHLGFRARPGAIDVGAQAGPLDLGGLAAAGAMAQLAFRLEVPVAFAARLSWLVVDPGFARDARDRAAQLVAAAPGDAAVAARYAGAGRTLGEGEVSAAVSWELFDGWLTLWLEGAHLTRRPDEGPRVHGARGRLQMQLAL
jgi:hypothetical protein